MYGCLQVCFQFSFKNLKVKSMQAILLGLMTFVAVVCNVDYLKKR